MALKTKKDCPFKVGDKVRYIGDVHWSGESLKHITMIIESIDNEGWCCGKIRGEGYHFSKFELASIGNYQIY